MYRRCGSETKIPRRAVDKRMSDTSCLAEEFLFKCRSFWIGVTIRGVDVELNWFSKVKEDMQAQRGGQDLDAVSAELKMCVKCVQGPSLSVYPRDCS